MDRMTDMKLRAYKGFFRDQFKEKTADILRNSRSLAEADEKLDGLVKEFDSAWEEIRDYYIPEDEEDEEEDD